MGAVVQGDVVYLFAFDVADEILTTRVERIMTRRPFPFEIRRDRGVPSDVPYIAFCITSAGESDAATWLAANRRGVAALLGATRPSMLADEQVAEALRIRRSYETTDLVVIDWDAALVIDFSGYVDDVLYVLEIANLQLGEYRAMTSCGCSGSRR